MLIIIGAVATAVMAAWLILLFMATEDDWVQGAYSKVLHNLEEMDRLREKDRKRAESLAQYHGVTAKVAGLLLGGSSEKKIAKLELENQRLQKGNLKSVSMLAMPGYVLQRRVDAIGKGSLNKTIYAQYAELSGKKYAANCTRQLLAQLLSYPILGVALSLTISVIMLGLGNTTGGLAVLAVGTALAGMLAYALYDDLKDKVAKRRAAISRQFPNVVSKLALLVTSGMTMDRAWKETAVSQEGDIYREMRKVSEERDNLVDPATAYANFIDRCGTKETTKLASAIIQNLSKGNAEIGSLLKGMAHEAWQERRHMAKRDSEKANTKLMIPTMLLFVAILIMIMVPVVTSFSGF